MAAPAANGADGVEAQAQAGGVPINVPPVAAPAQHHIDDDQDQQTDICRVCRCEASPDRPLFHPCICTGSIKFIHQECLLQWLRYSKKEFCELCNHRFSFTPIYSPDMPRRLPISIVLSGFLSTVAHAVRFWLHYTLVALAWLGVVPLTACRIYRALFTGSVTSILSLPIDVFSTENIVPDILQGCAVVTLTLLAFIGLVWLREQILHGGGPEWLDVDDALAAPADVANDAAAPEEEEDNQMNNNNIHLDDNQNQVADDNWEPAADDNNAAAEPLPQEPAAPEIEPAVPPEANANDAANADDGVNLNNLGDDGQWNPMEWDRAAEELTWERLLGLDGSLVFLEHVFWVVSLNTLFILVFAFCPYHLGHFTVMGLKMKNNISGAHFEGMLTTLVGYCIIGMSLVMLHAVAAVFRFRRSARIMGLCYVVVKVALLLIIEIVAFPVLCGYWIDLCSLALFDATLKDRQASYHQSPMASIFIHWLIGMVYVFYFASFVILLREVLRPGVLWFLRNLNDPDFNPIQEMIHLSLYRHLRRFCASLVMFGTSILVMLYLPSKIIKKVFPSFLPYITSQNNESQVDELAMELMLLLVILPAVQDQSHTREWLKAAIKGWCSVAAWALDLKSYLFGDEEEEEDVEPPPNDAPPNEDELPNDNFEDFDEEDEIVEEEEEDEEEEAEPQGAVAAAVNEIQMGLGAAHEALLLHRDVPTGFQPYQKPIMFPLRIAGLLTFMVFSWLVVSFLAMLVPVWLGRQVFSLCLSDLSSQIYELYTSAVGVYLCLLLVKATTLVTHWLKQGWAQLSEKMKEWAYIGMKASVTLFLLVFVIPLLFGFLLELVVLMPVKVPLNQSPVYFLWQDWALGAMYTKISVALTFMGPDWWMKQAIEQLYHDGIRGIDLSFLIPRLVIPVVTVLGLALALPHIFTHSLLPLVLSNEEILVAAQRRIYPALVIILLTSVLVVVQFKQFHKLYEHIKNDRYLVGRRLVNYNHPKSRSASASPPPAPPVPAAAGQ